MIPGLTSIIVPCYQHGQYVAEAIECGLAQTAPAEVIVVDDGSTDSTATVLRRYAGHPLVRVFHLSHNGPCVARNHGIDQARGEFVMFLDADDLIAPNKIEQQLTEMRPEIGWVICDGLIDDEASGKRELASKKYDYAGKELGGWIQALLTAGPFIPTFSPLVRRAVLGADIRFRDELIPEDWHFWHAVSGVARVSYLPEVLGTYRHRRTGRSRIPKKARKVSPTLIDPLRLNLGCGTQGTDCWHPLPGFVNLDKSIGWLWEDGLGDFIESSVAGITVSHSLMYVHLADWPRIFAEFARVLRFGGVVRITEDATDDPKSSRFGGWKGSQPGVTNTTAALVREHLARAGFTVHDATADASRYADTSLCQSWHGAPPDVFYVEGVKESCVLFEAHADDAALFASFTVLRYRPAVVTCFGSAGDYGSTELRAAETRDAMAILGAQSCEQWDGASITVKMRALDRVMRPALVWAPDVRTSHPDHLAVAQAAREVFGGRVRTYHTYDEGGKVTGALAPFEPAWVHAKLRALARYESQATHPRAHAFFLNDLREYLG